MPSESPKYNWRLEIKEGQINEMKTQLLATSSTYLRCYCTFKDKGKDVVIIKLVMKTRTLQLANKYGNYYSSIISVPGRKQDFKKHFGHHDLFEIVDLEKHETISLKTDSERVRLIRTSIIESETPFRQLSRLIRDARNGSDPDLLLHLVQNFQPYCGFANLAEIVRVYSSGIDSEQRDNHLLVQIAQFLNRTKPAQLVAKSFSDQLNGSQLERRALPPIHLMEKNRKKLRGDPTQPAEEKEDDYNDDDDDDDAGDAGDDPQDRDGPKEGRKNQERRRHNKRNGNNNNKNKHQNPPHGGGGRAKSNRQMKEQDHDDSEMDQEIEKKKIDNVEVVLAATSQVDENEQSLNAATKDFFEGLPGLQNISNEEDAIATFRPKISSDTEINQVIRTATQKLAAKEIVADPRKQTIYQGMVLTKS